MSKPQKGKANIPAPQQAKAKPAKPKVSDWGFLKENRVAAFIIFLFAFLLYANTITNQYAIDDSIVITDNAYTQQGVHGLKKIFSTDAFEGFFKENYHLVAGGRYRPLSMATFAVEYDLFGPAPIKDDTPKEYIAKKQKEHQHESHTMNAILYGLTGLILFVLLSYLFKTDKATNIFLSIPFLATLLFIAHPIHTEAVANLKGRDEIMVFLFSMMSLWMALKYVKTTNTRQLIWCGFFFALALLSKENAITFLAVIPVALFMFTNAKMEDYLKIVGPLFALSILYIIARAHFTGAKLNEEDSQELMNNPFLGLSFGDKYGVIFTTFWKYIQLLIFPHPLTHDYYPYQIPVKGMGNWKALAGFAVNVGLFIYGIRLALKKDSLGFAILFYFITFSIVSNVFITIGTNMGERFIYMPSFGFALAIAILLHRLLTSEKIKMAFQQRKMIVFAVLTIMLVGYSAKTFTRNLNWKNDFTLFKHDIAISPNSAKLQNALGGELIDQADKVENKAQQLQMDSEAIEHLKIAVKLHPKYSQAFLLMGNAYYKLKNVQAAMDNYNIAMQMRPGFYDAYFNVGVVYRDQGDYAKAIQNFKMAKNSKQVAPAFESLADAYNKMGRTDSAIIVYKEELKYFPNSQNAKTQIGILLSNQDPAKAMQFYKQDMADARAKLKTDPSNTDALMSLADMLEKSNKIDSSLLLYNRVLSIKPDNAFATYKIGQIYGKHLNDLNKSIEYIQKAIALDGKQVVFYEDLGVAYGIKGDIPNAIAANQKLLEVDPNYAKGYFNLGVSYLQLKDSVQANQNFQKAFQLDPSLRGGAH